MSGRSELVSLKARLDATFARIDQIDVDDLELRSDFARYLCVLVCGYLQRAVTTMLLHHTAMHASEAVTGYVAWRLTAGFRNPSAENIKQTFGRFNPSWGNDLEDFIIDEHAAAISSMLAQRHRIAHGEWSDITYTRVREHYGYIQDVVDRLADLVI